jgi:hypothetical protein
MFVYSNFKEEVVGCPPVQIAVFYNIIAKTQLVQRNTSNKFEANSNYKLPTQMFPHD